MGGLDSVVDYLFRAPPLPDLDLGLAEHVIGVKVAIAAALKGFYVAGVKDGLFVGLVVGLFLSTQPSRRSANV